MSNYSAPTNPSSSQAINLVRDMEKTDISSREVEIIDQVINLTKGKFKPTRVLSRSDYFGSGRVGAYHYLGDYQGRQVVLKIQAAQPKISEQWMIQQFAAQNQSRLIRPPIFYEVIPWADQRGYEAFIMEFVSGEHVLTSHQLQTKHQVQKFFQVYQEYRQFSLIRPWLPQPEPKFEQDFQNLVFLSRRVQPNSPHRRVEDADLVTQAKNLLAQAWAGAELEFQHGHFSAEDLIYQADQIVLFSNLFWKWKMPFYDAVFAYHWIMYGLASVEQITPEKIELQRQLWLTELANLPSITNSSQRKLLTAALLERAVAGLLVDSLAYIDAKHPMAGYLVAATRDEVKRLIGELQNLN